MVTLLPTGIQFGKVVSPKILIKYAQSQKQAFLICWQGPGNGSGCLHVRILVAIAALEQGTVARRDGIDAVDAKDPAFPDGLLTRERQSGELMKHSPVP